MKTLVSAQAKKLIGLVLLMLWAPLAFALSPYLLGDKVAGGDVSAVMAQVEKKLAAEGFTVLANHSPKGLPQYGVIITTEKGWLDAVRSMGGSNIAGATIRVGVKSDGTVSYINPEYWGRALFRTQYKSAEGAVKVVEGKLKKALGGSGKGFGGDEKADDLARYHYMAGMERFDCDKNELKSYGSFDAAVKAVQDNLAKKVNSTSKVYEVVMADKKIAVFGVAMNDPKTGEGSWLKKVGADHIAAMPYEIYIVNNKVNALYGRYRIAMAWPSLGMGTFMGISDAPDDILETLTGVAGGVYEKSSAF